MPAGEPPGRVGRGEKANGDASVGFAGAGVDGAHGGDFELEVDCLRSLWLLGEGLERGVDGDIGEQDRVGTFGVGADRCATGTWLVEVESVCPWRDGEADVACLDAVESLLGESLRSPERIPATPGVGSGCV